MSLVTFGLGVCAVGGESGGAGDVFVGAGFTASVVVALRAVHEVHRASVARGSGEVRCANVVSSLAAVASQDNLQVTKLC